MASKELVKFTEQYPALAPDGEMRELIDETLSAGGGITPFDLEALKIPGAGGKTWEVTDENGKVSGVADVEGIIVMQRNVRSYWRTPFDEGGGGTPPDCSSEDSITGRGVRFDDDSAGPHDCSSCPLSQFGSDRNGKGQACTQRRQLFLLTEGTMLPTLLSLPPSSLAGSKRYLLSLLNRRTSFMGVITGFGLEKVEGAQPYSRVLFRQVRKLEDAELQAVKSYASVLAPILAATPVTAGVANDDDDAV